MKKSEAVKVVEVTLFDFSFYSIDLKYYLRRASRLSTGLRASME